MHAVTKILVVFAVVLSILLSALTVAYSANAERVKSQYQAIAAQRDAFQGEMQQATSKHAEDRARLEGEIESVQSSLNSALSDKAGLQQDVSQTMADLKQAQVELQGVQARIDRLATMSQTQVILISSYRDELTGLREAELRTKQREIDLVAQINDLSGQLEVAIETNRALQEELVQLQSASGGIQTATGSARPAPGQPVRARITSVTTSPSGQLLAEIDAGSNDRLSEKMELTIVQGDRFAGRLILDRVELNSAVGAIDLTQGRIIKSGDIVTTIR